MMHLALFSVGVANVSLLVERLSTPSSFIPRPFSSVFFFALNPSLADVLHIEWPNFALSHRLGDIPAAARSGRRHRKTVLSDIATSFPERSAARILPSKSDFMLTENFGDGLSSMCLGKRCSIIMISSSGDRSEETTCLKCTVLVCHSKRAP